LGFAVIAPSSPDDWIGSTNPSAPSPHLSPDRQAAWEKLRNALRPGQQQMADWVGGPLAVAAVPGAGKSTGMAIAAALAIARFRLNPQRQLMVVTFTRSAAAGLKDKIRAALTELGLPHQGFSVQTLHGLAFQIMGRHPELSGLGDRAALIAPTQQHQTIRTCVDRWITVHPQTYQRLLTGVQFDGEEAERLRRQSVLRTEVLPDLAMTTIREAKSSGLRPEDLIAWQETARFSPTLEGMSAPGDDYGGLAIAAGLYAEYEQLLRSRNLIDYDDAILAALRILAHPPTRRLWQTRLFAVFEDEAQDSSPLQNRLIETLACDPEDPDRPPNLVRVGDPNQAINSTFTPADPRFFSEFCDRCFQRDRLARMDQSGRSSIAIIDAANFMQQWTNHHVATGLTQFDLATVTRPERNDPDRNNPDRNNPDRNNPDRNNPDRNDPDRNDPDRNNPDRNNPDPVPFAVQAIYPVAAGDPQPGANPLPIGSGLELHRPVDIHQTVELIGKRSRELFAADPQCRAAILVRTNDQGRFAAQALGDAFGDELRIYEVGQRDRQSHVPGELLTLLHFSDRPHSPDYLKATLRTLVERQVIPTQDLDRLASSPEQFLYPSPLAPPLPATAAQARRCCVGLLNARLALTPLQFLSFAALTLRYNQTELATADKLIEELRRRTQGDRRPTLLLNALTEIVQAEQFEPIDADNRDESPYTRPGQLTIITMHKAKGLDWDAVFIPFLQASNLPGQSWVPLQAQFLGPFHWPDCVRAQIRAAQQQRSPLPNTLDAWEEAQRLKLCEEYRLLYVAMTRAKRLLWMAAAHQAPFTWNKLETLQDREPCPVFQAIAPQFPTTSRFS
jgi:DNA helicase-2/ATP-dependent DNA helicase PcrA